MGGLELPKFDFYTIANGKAKTGVVLAHLGSEIEGWCMTKHLSVALNNLSTVEVFNVFRQQIEVLVIEVRKTSMVLRFKHG